MRKQKTESSEKEFVKALAKGDKALYVLRLYVAGITTKSTKAIENVKKICEDTLRAATSSK